MNFLAVPCSKAFLFIFVLSCHFLNILRGSIFVLSSSQSLVILWGCPETHTRVDYILLHGCDRMVVYTVEIQRGQDKELRYFRLP
ncbi:hypothetical protein BX600DRAFT_457978 [Xylariales sp. PMI_506]|nr:hypothetical protein BX600DRAFT_457978 [Xylariales sp. PMI_506]